MESTFLDRPATSFEEFKTQVNDLFIQETCTSWNDLCGDLDPLQRAYECYESPKEFVDWFIEKYDLIRKSEYGY